MSSSCAGNTPDGAEHATAPGRLEVVVCAECGVLLGDTSTSHSEQWSEPVHRRLMPGKQLPPSAAGEQRALNQASASQNDQRSPNRNAPIVPLNRHGDQVLALRRAWNVSVEPPGLDPRVHPAHMPIAPQSNSTSAEALPRTLLCASCRASLGVVTCLRNDGKLWHFVLNMDAVKRFPIGGGLAYDPSAESSKFGNGESSRRSTGHEDPEDSERGQETKRRKHTRAIEKDSVGTSAHTTAGIEQKVSQLSEDVYSVKQFLGLFDDRLTYLEQTLSQILAVRVMPPMPPPPTSMS
ncbi:hypothetical protein FVE85_4171 [Porphyridium purpureum]|uniref:Uncharacterized protein n=1 Tax=Porphyridium purpureum TaxID=35688 RepID=A0A5J4YS89_PORPP|nr:hypothetical protein FVE85_4171 [Porphyridium purpureum]|eukprot:POR7039..scf229_5